ncbi:MAG TPA: TetR/AcrR family transcriptional regulator [Solirubrobacteraceae bacterium]|nr:TetR/AcrR family transcriptional regulator [Solirubrobacteraceae bacterium]
MRAQHSELTHHEYQRTRILAAMVTAAATSGPESVTVGDITGLAGVSRGTFYALFAGRDDCLHVAIDDAVALATARAVARYDPQARWAERVRAGLEALLGLITEEPELARLCIARALAARTMHPALDTALEQLAQILDQGRRDHGAPRQPPPIAAQSLLGGALGLIYARLIAREERSLPELLNPLMSMIVLPYLGPAAARREESRREPARPVKPPAHRPSDQSPAEIQIRLTYRTARVLQVIRAQSGLSNSAVAARAGISDAGQISKLLTRLSRLGLIENTGAGQARGAANSWALTREGKELERTITRVSMYAA